MSTATLSKVTFSFSMTPNAFVNEIQSIKNGVYTKFVVNGIETDDILRCGNELACMFINHPDIEWKNEVSTLVHHDWYVWVQPFNKSIRAFVHQKMRKEYIEAH
jgi:hypothetical protein